MAKKHVLKPPTVMNRKKRCRKAAAGPIPGWDFIPIPKPKRYKVQVEMTITRVIEVEVNSVTPLSARRAVLCSWTGEGADRLNAGARDLQEANRRRPVCRSFDMSMGAKYKVIGVEEIDA